MKRPRPGSRPSPSLAEVLIVLSVGLVCLGFLAAFVVGVMWP